MARFPNAELELIWHLSLSPTESLLRDQRGWTKTKLQCLQAVQLNSHIYLLMLLRCLYGKTSLHLLFFIHETWRLGMAWSFFGERGCFGGLLVSFWWGALFLVYAICGLVSGFLEKYLARPCLRPRLHENNVLVEVMKPPPLTVTPPIQILLF